MHGEFMDKKVVTVTDLTVIDLGYVGDDMCTTVRFPVSSILNRYGDDGTFNLLLSSPSREKAHTINGLEASGRFVEWTVPAEELQIDGNGEAQLVYTDGHGKTHSKLWATKIKKSLIKAEE